MFLGCGKTIVLSNGGTEEIQMASYFPGRKCTWLVKVSMRDAVYFKVDIYRVPQ